MNPIYFIREFVEDFAEGSDEKSHIRLMYSFIKQYKIMHLDMKEFNIKNYEKKNNEECAEQIFKKLERYNRIENNSLYITCSDRQNSGKECLFYNFKKAINESFFKSKFEHAVRKGYYHLTYNDIYDIGIIWHDRISTRNLESLLQKYLENKNMFGYKNLILNISCTESTDNDFNVMKMCDIRVNRKE